jgi:hypothetical protein
MERLKTLCIRAGGNLHRAQAQYKERSDKKVGPKNSEVKEGDDVFLRVEVTEVGRNHKLESLVQGPYRVLENAGANFRLRIGAEDVRVSSDRVTTAPGRELSLVLREIPHPLTRCHTFRSTGLRTRRPSTDPQDNPVNRETERSALTFQRPRKRPIGPPVRKMPRFRENSWWRSSWILGKQRMEPGYTECGGSDTRLLRIHGNPKTAFRPHLFGGIGRQRGKLLVTKNRLGNLRLDYWP